MNVDPSTLDMDEMNIDPTHAKPLWEALFAITLAVEQLGMNHEVNQLRHVETGIGAYDFACRATREAIIKGEE